MTKGEKYRLKLKGSTQFFLVSVMSEKIGLSDFAEKNFYLSFLFPNSSGLENYVIYERLCVKTCNTYLNLNYACFLCHDIIYLIHGNFMQICIFECLKCNDECFLVNMLSLEKPDCLVLANLAYISLILFVMILLSCASHNSCSHTQIVAQIRCIYIGGALLDFLENV
jgi:hypothetical protein